MIGVVQILALMNSIVAHIGVLMDNFVFLVVVGLKLFSHVDLLHRRHVFPSGKALMTFPASRSGNERGAKE